jgi:hypothetical protein
VEGGDEEEYDHSPPPDPRQYGKLAPFAPRDHEFCKHPFS